MTFIVSGRHFGARCAHRFWMRTSLDLRRSSKHGAPPTVLNDESPPEASPEVAAFVPPSPEIAPDVPGRLGANLMYFARTLRAAGLPVGSGAVLDALLAVEAVGVARRDDFYWALHAVFVRRADQRPLFDEAFHVFWRNPKLLERVTSLLLPTVHTPPQADAQPAQPPAERRPLRRPRARGADP